MQVLKFGGTSVGQPQRMHQVTKLITRDSEAKIVVLSALSGSTNSLVEISNCLAEGNPQKAGELITSLRQHYNVFVQELLESEPSRLDAINVLDEHFGFLNTLVETSFSEPIRKQILAQGELLSTKLFRTYLAEQNIPSKLISAFDFMKTNAEMEPDVNHLESSLKTILNEHGNEGLFITQGFICKNYKGEIDNLQRGGSDYTASLIGAAIRASEIQIWTDIDGMHNNDPRIVDQTVPISELSFDEAAELAYFGAKILHPASIWPAQKFGIPVKLLNTMHPEAKGTLISKSTISDEIKAVAAKDGITAIKVKSSRMLLAYGFLTKIFQVFEAYKTPIDMITTSEVAVSLTIDDKTNLLKIKEALEPLGLVEIDNNQSIICVVGNFVAERKGVVTNIFDALKSVPIRMISYGGSRHNISLLIDSYYKEEALKNLNKHLFNL